MHRCLNSVNSKMLQFYFELSKEISNNYFKAIYGSKFLDCLSKELLNQLPNVKWLSSRNLRYIESFYSLYSEDVKKMPRLVAELFSIPWGIIDIFICHKKIIVD